jgi:glycosyltransferase involved in cell wall biosynthesis
VADAPPVLFVLKGYPRLSETFIAQEILALEQRGLDIRIVSLRHPTDRHTHPVHRAIRAPVTYLPEYLHHEPARVMRAWAAARRLPGYAEAYRLFLADLARDRTRNRVRRFGQACVLAAEAPADARHVHAHFAHTPASVARYAAVMRGLPFSISAHAKDIWTSPDWDIAEKLNHARWTVTCTKSGAAHLAALAATPECVSLVYHGLDLSRFPDVRATGSARDGSDPGDPVRLLSVGRAVAKKGYGGLLNALAALPDDLHWRMVHIGGGGDLADLKAQARRLGLEARIDWRGAQPQDAVLAAYAEADLFVLNSRVAADGDRDGLPNVLMEAQAMGLACLSTRVSAIPELIDDGATGVLIDPGDDDALAAALAALIADPARRSALGEAGRARVRARFSMTAGIDDLARRFGLDAAAGRAAE